MATKCAKWGVKGDEMMRKHDDPVQIGELLAWVYADLQRLAREAQEESPGGDEDAGIPPDD